MNLKLTRPLAFIDLETTGVNVASDRIVEISILKVLPSGEKEVKTQRINPGIPIPAVASSIHGIYDKDVAQEPKFKDVAQLLANFLQGADLAGYNSNKFDIPVLAEEFLRVEVEFDLENRRLVDVQNVFHIMEPRTLVAAYKFYCGKELANAHSAEADIRATHEVLEAQLEKYTNLKPEVDFLHEFTYKTKAADLAGRVVYNEAGEEVFNFGKHAGKKVAEVFRAEPSYYDWMMKGDFPLYTKRVITKIKLKMNFGK
ncbi:MAG: 3'-5' exonuclease [Bacteroidia bacterium]|nr:3'-5' exonuclease [Bacteroidia bacterium]